MIRSGIFILVSIFLAYISRRSFLHPRSHGLFRFIAWEFILILILKNSTHWIDERFSPVRLLSTILLFTSIYLVVHGVYLLIALGKQDKRRRSDPALLGFEKTSALVKVGVYKYIRHPMCSSLLFLAWGVFLKDPSWVGLLLVLLSSVFLILTAKADESECKVYFGGEYRTYMETTKSFIPFLF